MREDALILQREMFGDMGSELSGDFYNDIQDFYDFGSNWNLDPKLEEIVGSKGTVSFEVERLATEVIAREISRRLTDIRSIFWSIGVAYREVDVDLSYDIHAEGNKLTIILNHSDKGEIKRKSYRKVIDWLRRDMISSGLEAWDNEEHWANFKTLTEISDDLATVLSQAGKNQLGTLTISALPQDILTCSYTTTWSSCFDIDGENCLAPYMYAANQNVLVVYFIPHDASVHTVNLGGHEVDNKYWRQFFFVDVEGNVLPSSSAYPADSNSLTNAALDYIQSRIGGVLKEKPSAIIETTAYFDGLDEKGLFVKDVEYFRLSADGEVCPRSGLALDSSSSLVHTSEAGFACCDYCGELYSEDEMNTIQDSDDNESDICDYCAENHFYCELSENYLDTDYSDDHMGYLLDKYRYSYINANNARNGSTPSGFTLPAVTEVEVIAVENKLDDDARLSKVLSELDPEIQEGIAYPTFIYGTLESDYVKLTHSLVVDLGLDEDLYYYAVEV